MNQAVSSAASSAASRNARPARAMGRASVMLALGDTVSFAGANDALWRIEAGDPPRLVRVGARHDGRAGATACATVSEAALRFEVSANEEHSSLTITGLGGATLDLGERVHHYTLLTLARQRLQDARRGFGAEAQGWIGSAQLAKMLGLDLSHLNIQLYRVRTQLAAARGGEVAPELVQRRRGELRLAPLAFEIVRGGRAEGRYRPSRAT